MADKKIYVFSTLTCDQRYVQYEQGQNDQPIEGRSVLIKGGTGVANKRLITPLGVCTTITESELELLKENKLFQLHESNGYIKVQNKSADPEKVAADMELADPSAPLTPSDYRKGGKFGEQEEPKVGAL
jgi:hypothetical protein